MEKVDNSLKLLFLQKKRIKLLEQEQSMGTNCHTKDWLSIRNNIRKLDREILELKNARRCG